MRSQKFDSAYVPSVRRRQIKVRTALGWVACRERICSLSELREWLVSVDDENEVLDSYFSVSRFLNPHRVRGYASSWRGSPRLDKMILGSDFVFDFDQKHMPGGVDAYDVAVKVFGLLRGGYDDVNFVRTGKGWHVVVLDWYEKFCRRDVAVMDRYFYISAMKRRFAGMFWRSGIPFDYPVSIDSFRCIRMWNSPYHDGTLCEWRKNEVVPRSYASSPLRASQLATGIPSELKGDDYTSLRKPSALIKDSVGSGFLGKGEDSAQRQIFMVDVV